MGETLRGRPRLNLELSQILEAIRRRRQVVAAARELDCSDAYIHVRLKRAGLTLRDVLGARDLETLLHGQDNPLWFLNVLSHNGQAILVIVGFLRNLSCYGFEIGTSLRASWTSIEPL